MEIRYPESEISLGGAVVRAVTGIILLLETEHAIAILGIVWAVLSLPLFQWWYTDISLYEDIDGYKTDWRLRRTQVRTDLTAEGIIRPKWKHELSLFREIRKRYPDTLYQYRPDWLGRQSLEIYIPSIKTGIEYRGIQHYHPVEFFGGEDALAQRKELDRTKKEPCEINGVKLIEWPYDMDPTIKNLKTMLPKD